MILDQRALESEFQRIRDALKIPRDFPPEALAEAAAAADRDVLEDARARHYEDHRGIPFLTIDPPRSRDLDQAFYAARSADGGYLVQYAIADVGFFVARGGAIEREAWRRGETLYSPDQRTPLYPPALSEGAASLLEGLTRPAVLFSLRFDAEGATAGCEIRRAIVRSRAQLSYPEVSAHLEAEARRAGSGALAGQDFSSSLALLAELGPLRQAREAARGGVSLPIPAQQVERWTSALAGYRLVFDDSSAVEAWNAQISLSAGMAAAELMVARGVGLLRALDPPRPNLLRALRLMARTLDITWPAEMGYHDFVRSLEMTDPRHVAIMHQAAKVMGGARYVAFDGSVPAEASHAAIAAYYAHATAPLRRLADRYVLDLIVELAAGRSCNSALTEALGQLPAVMQSAAYRAQMLESAIVNLAEAVLLSPRAGEVFRGLVIDRRQDGFEAQIKDPPVRAAVRVRPEERARFALGDEVSLRLLASDINLRSVRFAVLSET